MGKDKQLTIEEVAETFRVEPKTIANWVTSKKPGFPRGFKLGTGRNVPRRWMQSEIDQYVKDCRDQAA